VRKRSKRSTKKAPDADDGTVRGEPLDPVRVVERVLTRPDGTTLKVRVPVYPPFELKKRPAAKTPDRRKTRRSW
jgi:hypothetical protein